MPPNECKSPENGVIYPDDSGGATLINLRLVPGLASAVSFTSVYLAYVCMQCNVMQCNVM